jgi:hypothetical protein
MNLQGIPIAFRDLESRLKLYCGSIPELVSTAKTVTFARAVVKLGEMTDKHLLNRSCSVTVDRSAAAYISRIRHES